MLKWSAFAMLAILFLAAGSWLSGVLWKLDDDKAHFAILQGLEYSHRGKLKSKDLPTIFTPTAGPGVGEAFLVLEHPARSGIGIWVALNKLQTDGRLFAVPEIALDDLRCDDLRNLDVDRVASAHVAKKLYASCVK